MGKYKTTVALLCLKEGIRLQRVPYRGGDIPVRLKDSGLVSLIGESCLLLLCGVNESLKVVV